MEAPVFKTTFTLDFKSQLRASMQIALAPWPTRLFIGAVVVLPLLAWLAQSLTGIDLARFDPLGPPGWPQAAGCTLLMVVLLPGLTALNIWLRSRGNRMLKEPRHLTFGPDGILAEGASFRNLMKWDAVSKATESGSFFFIYLSRHTLFYVPKAAFPAASDADRCREVLRFYLQEKARLRGPG
jgi:hypothetical protein